MFLIPFYAQLEEMRVTEWSDSERPILIKKGTNQLVRPSLVTWEIPVTPGAFALLLSYFSHTPGNQVPERIQSTSARRLQPKGFPSPAYQAEF